MSKRRGRRLRLRRSIGRSDISVPLSYRTWEYASAVLRRFVRSDRLPRVWQSTRGTAAGSRDPHACGEGASGAKSAPRRDPHACGEDPGGRPTIPSSPRRRPGTGPHRGLSRPPARLNPACRQRRCRSAGLTPAVCRAAWASRGAARPPCRAAHAADGHGNACSGPASAARSRTAPPLHWAAACSRSSGTRRCHVRAAFRCRVARCPRRDRGLLRSDGLASAAVLDRGRLLATPARCPADRAAPRRLPQVAGSARGPAVSDSRAQPQPVPRRAARGRPAARAVGCCPA